MNMVRCSENCTYQKDGYCTLESGGAVSSTNSQCCYYKKKSDSTEFKA